MLERAPYGAWPSPISAQEVASGPSRPGDVVVDGTGVYVGESRPTEEGRSVIVRLETPGAGQAVDVLPSGHAARSRVHEYGGGAFSVRDGTLVYCNDADQALYLRGPGERTRRLTPLPTPAAATDATQLGQRRFAEPVIDSLRQRVLCVSEKHRDHPSDETRAENSVVGVGYGARTGRIETLLSGKDFYSSLRLSHDGRRLAWLSWVHPQMPWDGSELWVSELDETGAVGRPRLIAGGENESIFQPEWDERGGLWFVSDRSGYWNLYHLEQGELRAACPRPAEFGLPQWVLGMSTYCLLDGGDLLTTFSESGSWRLGRLCRETGELRVLETQYTEYSTLRSCPTGAVLLAASPSHSTALVHYDESSGALTTLRSFGPITATGGGAQFSKPQPVEFTTSGGAVAYGMHYPPTHSEFRGMPGERPPLLVRVHGGPTAQASTALNLRTQYWTSRGFAVLDVNYRGSTGYGRRFRQSLDGQWGVADVDDCIAGALSLVERGLADRQRLCISGGSAGGYTVLAALTFHDVFAAGAVYYGVSDLTALARDTHKFESRYLERLVGRYPEDRAVYEARSPLLHLEQLRSPTVFFHGALDRVTPPNQATRAVDALRDGGVPVAYVSYESEGHGFRKAETIRSALDGELSFYCQIFNIVPPGALPPLRVDNLPASESPSISD